jgi:hypothetical protein
MDAPRIHSLIEFKPDTAYALDRLYAEWQQAESVAEHRGWTGETVAAVEAAYAAYVDALEAARGSGTQDNGWAEYENWLEHEDYLASMDDASYRKGF